LIGSNVVDRIGSLTDPAHNDARGWQSRAAAYISLSYLGFTTRITGADNPQADD
jgi:hypothetical protein